MTKDKPTKRPKNLTKIMNKAPTTVAATHDPSTMSGDTPLTSQTFGDYVRRARCQKSIKILDAARDLKLRTDYLEAIEEGRFDALPPPPYLQGFVRSYLGYLGLNVDECMHLLKQIYHPNPSQGSAVAASPSLEERLPDRRVLMITATLGLLVIGCGFWAFSPSGSRKSTETVGSSLNSSPSQIAVAQPQGQVALVVDAPPSQASSISIDHAPEPSVLEHDGIAPAASRIHIRATATSWVRLYDHEGKTHVDRVLKRGDVIDGPNGLFLATGNAGGIEIVVDGSAIYALGKQGLVRRDLKLDPETIATQLATHDTVSDAPISAAKAKEPNAFHAQKAATTVASPAAHPSPEPKAPQGARATGAP